MVWNQMSKLIHIMLKNIRTSAFSRLMFLPFDIHRGGDSKHAWKASAPRMRLSSVVKELASARLQLTQSEISLGEMSHAREFTKVCPFQ